MKIEREDTCIWKEIWGIGIIYITECDKRHEIKEEELSIFKFCPYCGGKIFKETL
jgi:hypothetical protein